MTNPLGQAIVYLIQVVFGLYILAVMLRFLFQLVRADFYNPISQAIVKITNLPLIQLRRLIPGLWGVDLASVALLLALQALEIFLVVLIQDGYAGHPWGLVVLSLAQLLRMAIYIFIVAMIIRIVISWINPAAGYNPVVGLLASLTEPLMRPARQIIPPISGLDLSPLIVFVVLQLILILLIRPLGQIGTALL